MAHTHTGILLHISRLRKALYHGVFIAFSHSLKNISAFDVSTLYYLARATDGTVIRIVQDTGHSSASVVRY